MSEFDEITSQAELSAERSAEVFEAAGERIARALDGAARAGELSFNRMAESILQDLARTAITDLILDPLSNAISTLGAGTKTGGVTVNMNVSGVSDAASFERSRNQINAGLARAVRSGQTYG